MKNLFKYEINESIAAKAAMNCVHKRLFKELYSFGSPTPQEEVTRGDYDPYEWEYDDYGNEEKRHLIHKALVQAGLIQSEKEGWQFNNEIQQLLDKTNFPVSDAKSAAEFVKAYGQQIVGGAQEQEEDYGMNDLRKWRDSLDFSNDNDYDDEEDYSDDSVGIDMIADLLVANGEISEEEKESVKPHIKELLDYHGLWIGEDEHEAERFINLYWDN